MKTSNKKFIKIVALPVMVISAIGYVSGMALRPFERTVDKWTIIDGQHYRITVTNQNEGVRMVAPVIFQAVEKVVLETNRDETISIETRIRLMNLDIPQDTEIDIINFSKPQI